MRMPMFAAALALAAGPFLSAPGFAAPWAVDKSHSHVTFTVDNLGFSITQGQFRTFDAAIDFDPDNVEAARVEFTIDAGSVDTNSDARDRHLRSQEFLDVKAHPEIRFVSNRVRLIDETTAEVTGDLTLKGATREETFIARLIRIAPSPFKPDTRIAGFRVEGEIARTDYGLSYGAPAIGVVVPIRLDLQITPAR